MRKESALAGLGQQTINYIDGMETLEVVTAFTEKADGRRLEIDPATILTRDAASGLNAVYLRDSKTKVLIFRDVAVGDTLVYTTLRQIRQTAFEGHFNAGGVYLRSQPWGTVKQTFDAPKSMPLRIAKSGVGVVHTMREEGDRVSHTLTYTGDTKRVPEEVGAVSPVDREPQFALTTFVDYDALGAAYWRDAGPKAVVTPELQAIAAEIVRGAEGKRAEADAIDRWMKRNVRYVAVYLGRQRWIPNAATAVLGNKYGDCKDMATLMTALLKARGIAVEHVLINLGNAYALPELPPGSFNHVIVYLPELGLYTDPTATLSRFGVLSHLAYDKPVLHAWEAGVRQARTPAMKPSEHETTARTKVAVAADGAISGTTQQTATGIFAASARSFYLRAQGEGFEQAAERMLGAMRTPGKGKFEASSPSELKEPYLITATFTLNDKLVPPLRGARRMPAGLPIHARPGQFLLAQRNKDRKQPFVCFGGRQIEEVEIDFAPELTMPRRPIGRTIESKAFVYKVSYVIDGRVMKVRREFTSLVPGQVCGAELEGELAEPLKAAAESVFSPIVFSAVGDNGPGDYAKIPAKERSGSAKSK